MARLLRFPFSSITARQEPRPIENKTAVPLRAPLLKNPLRDPIRGRGNKDTELALIRVFRAHRITGVASPAGGVRGLLFLALLPAARNEAPEQRNVLAEQTRRQHHPRPTGETDVAPERLAGVAPLGT
jgi:hypothetical protein